MPALQHVHTYTLFKSRSKGKPVYEKVFRCADPNCTHFAKYEMVLDKISKCNLCGSEFILDRESLKRVEPRCINCSETKKAKERKAIKKVLGSVLNNEPSDGDEVPDPLGEFLK